jgi:hypothetical protein
MEPSFAERLRAVPWCDYRTAYGPATFAVPNQLQKLAGNDPHAALAAANDLWAGLCHQHVRIDTAALPSLPFILLVLNTADRALTVELLDILEGFAKGVNRQRFEKYQRSLGRTEIAPDEPWVVNLREALNAERQRFQRLLSSSDGEIAGYAQRILAELVDGSAEQ